MPLNTYQQKRDFKKSPEPKGELKGSKGNYLQFVIHKHDASHPHYDLRLEGGGVLKSWAIPKEPDLDAGKKILAIMVEDHPFDYKNFEGVIPEGNYGAGTVMIWDSGVYYAIGASNREESEREILDGLKKGEIGFVLEGKKLRGGFSLVKFKKGKDNSWLLIKKNDQFANKEIKGKDISVKTGRMMEEIAENKKIKKFAGRYLEIHIKGAPRAKLPEIYKPMLAHLVKEPFNRKNWLFEIKYDGYRAIARIDDASAEIFSRNGLSFNGRFSSIAESLKHVPYKVILDGEIVVTDKQGKSDFGLLQNYIKTGDGYPVYCVFDILHFQDYDLKNLPLAKRKEILKEILPELPNVKYVSHIEERGEALFKMTAERGIEGIIAKDEESVYEPGQRSVHWLKIKKMNRQEAVIGGFTEPRGERRGIGALVLGVYEDDDLVYIGHTGGAFAGEKLAEMRKRLKPLIKKISPFKKEPKTNGKVHWVEPKLVCEAKFSNWTKDGYMRQPIFLGLREDKNPREIKREKAEDAKLIAKESKGAIKHKLKTADNSEFKNLDKIFWPKEGYTKGDLLDYYEKIAPIILPYLKDRPESLHRFPDGVEGKNFFQKNMEKIPGGTETKTIYSETQDREINYILCQDRETLLYLVNLGCIELNPWNSRIKSLDNPDYIVFDIDPGEAPFRKAVQTALVTHAVLGETGVKNFCKTSGATGLHVFVPLGGNYSYEQAREFVKLINIIVNGRLPKITTLERSPGERDSRIYLDYLQNRKGQTTASAYSVSPLPGAPVSTPLRWEEVNFDLNPKSFNIKNIFERIKKIGDVWEGVLGEGIDMEKALHKLERFLEIKKGGGS